MQEKCRWHLHRGLIKKDNNLAVAYGRNLFVFCDVSSWPIHGTNGDDATKRLYFGSVRGDGARGQSVAAAGPLRDPWTNRCVPVRLCANVEGPSDAVRPLDTLFAKSQLRQPPA